MEAIREEIGSPYPDTWNGPLLGIDWGEKRIGLAITDESLTFSERLKVLRWDRSLKDPPAPGSSLVSELRGLLQSRSVKGIVFGVPWYHLSGDPNPKASLFLATGRRLCTVLKIPVYFWDEGMTSYQARYSMRSESSRIDRNSGAKDPIDALSAALMLQSFLDERVKNQPMRAKRVTGDDD